jgi:hypothetical protein
LLKKCYFASLSLRKAKFYTFKKLKKKNYIFNLSNGSLMIIYIDKILKASIFISSKTDF